MWETGNDADAGAAGIVLRFVKERLADHAGKGGSVPLVVGLCGAQGIGKSTLCDRVAERLRGAGVRMIVLCLDDLYLGKAARARLARDVHPLFATRGVPGTHDAALGMRLFDAAGREGAIAVPRFDKARDEPRPPSQWPIIRTPVDLVLFEGWCVGAVPQDAEALRTPVNALEHEEDRDAIWRNAVNEALAGPYRALFGRIDALILLAAPSFNVVAAWRMQQERDLARRLDGGTGSEGRAMNRQEIARFVRHYERLTRAILAEMPARADLVLAMDRERRVSGVRQATRSGGSRPSK